MEKITILLTAIALACSNPELPQQEIANDTYISQEIQETCIKYAEEYDICPELIMAMVETESSGDQYAKNGNCLGLMQISTKWHKDRMEKYAVEDIYDIDDNIHLGVDYLSELIEQNGDEISYILDLYNGNSKAEWNLEHGVLSSYSSKILTRAAELERIHGK